MCKNWVGRRRIRSVCGTVEDIHSNKICRFWTRCKLMLVVLYNDPNKKLSYRQGTALCVVSVEILPIAMQQCRNYLYDKSWKKIEVMKLEGYSGTMCNRHVHSTVTRSSRFHCPIGVINKPTTDELWISPAYRRLAVGKFSKSTM